MFAIKGTNTEWVIPFRKEAITDCFPLIRCAGNLRNKDFSFQLNVGGAAPVQDQAAYQEDGPDFEPQDNEAFEINLKKSTSMPLDSTKKRKTESRVAIWDISIPNLRKLGLCESPWD